MKVETKYEIGQKIWVVYSNNGEAAVYQDTIDEICINKAGLLYLTKIAYVELEEDEIIPYQNDSRLLSKIKEITQRKEILENE